jgi:hypothetical protein
MKRLLTVILAILLMFSIAACGGNKKSVGKESSGAGQVKKEPAESKESKGQTEETDQKEQTELVDSPAQAAGQTDIICVNYKAYSEARNKFDEYVLEQSYDHKIVSAKLSMAVVLELKTINYLLTLEFMGESIKSFGKFDADFETKMLKIGWADDAELEYNEGTRYTLKGTNSDGSALEIKVVYDGRSDSLRLEGYKDDTLEIIFEYIRTGGGYAAQYYFETIIGYDRGTAIEGLCTYRTIFDGDNGSCARFDNVKSEPASIFGSVPDAESFIEGATHWFTIKDGSFTGNLGGEKF